MHWKFMQQKQPHTSSDFVHVSMAEKARIRRDKFTTP